jgi:hypothetical protein
MNHNVTVQRVVSSFGVYLIFRRRLWGDLAREWCKLLDIIHGTNLRSGDDRVSWYLSDKGFSVKSLCNKLQTRVPIKVFGKMWELKVPAKVKCFLWSLMWGKTLTKMNSLKRGWVGDKQCMFYASDESIDHLFFAYPLARFVWGIFQCAFDTPKQPQKMCEVNIWLNKMQASHMLFAKHIMAATFWALWKTRNKACFDNIMPADPCELIYVICQHIDYWSNLQKPGTRKAVARGIKQVKMVIQQVFTQMRGWAPLCRRIDSG